MLDFEVIFVIIVLNAGLTYYIDDSEQIKSLINSTNSSLHTCNPKKVADGSSKCSRYPEQER